MEFPYVCRGIVAVLSPAALCATAVLLVTLHSEPEGSSKFAANLVPPSLGLLCSCLACFWKGIFLQRSIVLYYLHRSLVKPFLSSVLLVPIFPFQYLFSVLHRLLNMFLSLPDARLH